MLNAESRSNGETKIMDPFSINRIAQLQHKETLEWAEKQRRHAHLRKSHWQLGRLLMLPVRKIIHAVRTSTKKKVPTTTAAKTSNCESDYNFG
jgi:hypothetical protein